ncbi:MAG: hypothetical protein J7L17_04365 [Thaumarchaeota archaeon]|nr:hypothetical protein [Nitrososphaerota archaeon]
MSRTFVVVWEGLDAAGKTTLISEAKKILEAKGFRILVYKTPSSTRTGEFAKTYGNEPGIDPLTRMLLFLANTSDDSRIIRREIEEKSPDLYFIDRYYLCSIAYGFAFSKLKGAKVTEEDFKEFIKIVEKLGEGIFVNPDLYLIIDAPEEDRIRRLSEKRSQGGLEEVLERSLEMQRRVKEFYKVFQKMNPDKVVWIMNPQGRLREAASQIVRELLSRMR